MIFDLKNQDKTGDEKAVLAAKDSETNLSKLNENDFGYFPQILISVITIEVQKWHPFYNFHIVMM